jgi:hypothetical protein
MAMTQRLGREELLVAVLLMEDSLLNNSSLQWVMIRNRRPVLLAKLVKQWL